MMQLDLEASRCGIALPADRTGHGSGHTRKQARMPCNLIARQLTS
jgi:hypothetical protein